ncbi:D-inositol 3-phosphate glycosyltransferase [bacterium BMS3Abin11]|nr:D-inositol 3-phosphate glycosyltransferase [bacterium BMS3Abin11]
MSPCTKTTVLLNAAPLFTVLSGVARYTRSLYLAILEQQLAEVSYSCNGNIKKIMPEQTSGPKVGNLPWRVREVLREVRLKHIEYKLNKIVSKGGFDVYHETGAFPLLKNTQIPTVMTIYDLSLVNFKHCHPVDRVRNFERHFYKRAHLVKHFITISEFVRQEIIKDLHIPPDKVTAIPLGVDKKFTRKPEADISRYKKEKALPDRCILTVGTHEPRKNIATLVRAMALTKEKYTLVSIGWSGWLNTEFHQEVRKLNMEKRIIYLGHVPDDELVLLYNCASLMVYPSLYEGFGLPILEAMACGCPVISSNTSSMPEVAGDAAILISPEDEKRLAHEIDRVMQDKELSQQLIESGYKRASEFSWDNTALRTMSIFKQAIASN